MKNWYKELEDRFATFPAHIQLLNMVSDLKKAENLLHINKKGAINHLYRVIILLDYIIADPKWNRKLKELLRLREVIGSIIVDDKPLGNISQMITATSLLDPLAYKAIKRN